MHTTMRQAKHTTRLSSIDNDANPFKLFSRITGDVSFNKFNKELTTVSTTLM